jgi:hemoglobin
MSERGNSPTRPDGARSATVNTVYDQIGGEDAVRRLVDAFYDIVEFEAEGSELLILHLRGHGVAHSRIEQFNFLSGFLGGPRYYVEKHGHSNVRYMHEHVDISTAAKDAWLHCMSIAIDRAGLTFAKEQLLEPFTRVATVLHEASIQRRQKDTGS